MTDLANIMNWCNENYVKFEIKNRTYFKDDFIYDCKITMNFNYYRAIFIFKASTNGTTDNQCVYRLYNDNDKYTVQHIFDDLGVDLLEVIYEKLKSYEDDFGDFE